MAYNAKILLGKIIKAYGFEGAVTIKPEKTFEEEIPEMESVFLEIEGKPVPFIISESEITDYNLIRLRFEGYDSVDKINEFIGCRVFLTSMETEITPDNEFSDFRSYKIHLSDNSFLGTVKNIIDNPGQQLLSIETEKGQEILIPLHEDFILRVDNKKKIIKVDLPEGLTEINQ